MLASMAKRKAASQKAIGCLLGATLACSKLPPAPLADDASVGPAAVFDDTTGRASGRAASASTASVTLLERGRTPRRKLQYAWRIGQSEVLTIDLRTTLSRELAETRGREVPLPPVHIAVAIEPKSVSPAGDLEYAWHVIEGSVAEDAGAPSQLADGMRIEVAAVQTLSGTGFVTSRGLAERVSIAAAPRTDAGATGQMVEQVVQTLRDLAVPLPEEEVGLDGRWRKVSLLVTPEAQITQTETFTLVSLRDNTGTLDDSLAQTAPSQALHVPGVPRNSQARMESMLFSGNAKTRLDLSRLVPQTRLDGTTTMVVSDDSHRSTMVLRVEILLSGSVR